MLLSGPLWILIFTVPYLNIESIQILVLRGWSWTSSFEFLNGYGQLLFNYNLQRIEPDRGWKRKHESELVGKDEGCFSTWCSFKSFFSVFALKSMSSQWSKGHNPGPLTICILILLLLNNNFRILIPGVSMNALYFLLNVLRMYFGGWKSFPALKQSWIKNYTSELVL